LLENAFERLLIQNSFGWPAKIFRLGDMAAASVGRARPKARRLRSLELNAVDEELGFSASVGFLGRPSLARRVFVSLAIRLISSAAAVAAAHFGRQ